MMRLRAGRLLCLTTIAALLAGLAGREARGQGPKGAVPGGDRPLGWASVAGGTTGGQGGDVVTVSDAEAFREHLRSDERLIIRVSGTILLTEAVRIPSNKTILGVGSDATIRGGGLRLRRVSNVIVRNLTITDAAPDAIDIEGADHVWIDHCDLSRGQDGLVDIKRGADYVTVSWNHFHDHGKVTLVGHSDKPSARAEDEGRLRVTYHHNFFDGTESRHPRVRYADPVHVFNNYFLRNDHGVHSSMDAGVLVEANYFEGVRHPTQTDFGASPDEGNIVERDNLYKNCQYPPRVRGTVKEPRGFYAYTLDEAAAVPAIVRRGAGVGKIGG